MAQTIVIAIGDCGRHVDRQRIVGIRGDRMIHRLQLGEAVATRRIDHQLPAPIIGGQYLAASIPAGTLGCKRKTAWPVGAVGKAQRARNIAIQPACLVDRHIAGRQFRPIVKNMDINLPACSG